MCVWFCSIFTFDNIVKFAQIVTPAVFAWLAYTIAKGNSQRDKQRLKHELYDKRLRVFQDLKNLIEFYVYARDLTTEKILIEEPKVGKRFDDSRGVSNFLFDEDVVTYLNYIDSNTREYYHVLCGKETAKTEDERKMYGKLVQDMKKWFIDQEEECIEKFRSYLEINHKDSKN